MMFDGFEKTPSSSLCRVLRYSDVLNASFLRICTPRIWGFYKTVRNDAFYESIMFGITFLTK